MTKFDTRNKTGNIEIRVFAYDAKRHSRPHFHADGPDRSASIALDDFAALESDLRGKEMKAVLAWAEDNRDALAAEWNRLNPAEPLADA